MKKKTLLGIFVALIIVLVFAYRLRIDGFATVPFPGESTDEYSNAWVGMSLIELGYPVGISGMPVYPNLSFRYINTDRIYSSNTVMGNTLPIASPWFDHPPLMGVVTGGFAYLRGARVFEDVAAAIIRKPVIWAAVASIGLVCWLGWLVFGPVAGLTAALIMTVSPLLIINSRMVQAENMIVPVFLSALISIYYYLKFGNRRWYYLAAVIAGTGLLFKLSAGSVVISLVLLLITSRIDKWRKIQDIVLLFIIAAGFLSMFAVFGMVYDWQLFNDMVSGNANRSYGIGFQALFELITITKVTGKIYLTDGWPLLGWLSFAFLFTKKNPAVKFIIIPLVSYLATYFFFGSETFGWYRIPIYPFLYLAGAVFLTDCWKRGKALPPILLLFIPIGIAAQKLGAIDRLVIPIDYWRITTPAILLLVTCLDFSSLKSKERWGRMILIAVFFFALWISIRYANVIDVNYWYRVT